MQVKEGIIIPEHELEITTSRAGGPGGQHVNKSDTRITVRWNVPSTRALDEAQKSRILQKLQSQLTAEGDIIIHNSSSRSQQHNKQNALDQLAYTIRKALHVPKKRMKSIAPRSAQESRLRAKSVRSMVKKLRNKKSFDE